MPDRDWSCHKQPQPFLYTGEKYGKKQKSYVAGASGTKCRGIVRVKTENQDSQVKDSDFDLNA